MLLSVGLADSFAVIYACGGVFLFVLKWFLRVRSTQFIMLIYRRANNAEKCMRLREEKTKCEDAENIESSSSYAQN